MNKLSKVYLDIINEIIPFPEPTLEVTKEDIEGMKEIWIGLCIKAEEGVNREITQDERYGVVGCAVIATNNWYPNQVTDFVSRFLNNFKNLDSMIICKDCKEYVDILNETYGDLKYSEDEKDLIAMIVSSNYLLDKFMRNKYDIV